VIYKNWSAIAQASSEHFKAFLIAETDEEILGGIRVGFPGLFSDAPIRAPVYTATELRSRALGLSRKEGNDPETVAHDTELEWFRGLREDGAVLLYFLKSDGGIPNTIPQQLSGKRLQAGIKVVYEEHEYVVVGIPRIAALGKTLRTTQLQNIDWICLAPAEIIDLTR
jgi:hypothetical protein